MEETVFPTKTNLIKYKETLEFSEVGFKLLDKKRNILIRELMTYVEKANELEQKIQKTFMEAYDALFKANVTLGIKNVSDTADSIPVANDFSIVYKSIMGVEVPTIKYDEKEIVPRYSFYRTNSAMDLAHEKFNEVRYLIYESAQVENAVYRLAIEIIKTKKKTNALENIQIPKLKEIIKMIAESIEEIEREGFFRLKILKKKMEKN